MIQLELKYQTRNTILSNFSFFKVLLFTMGFVTAEEIYAKDSKLKRDDVKILQEWMDKEQHLPKITETMLLFFLHSCYYKIEATKTCIENFFTIRLHCPEFFKNQNPKDKDVEQQLKILCMVVLPNKTKENYSVMITRLIDTNPELYDYNNQIKAIDMIATLTLMQRGPSDGQVMIMDSEGFGFAHMMKANLTSSRKHLTFVQEALPVRLKMIHIVNVSATTEKFLGILKPFIKKELFDMIHLHRTPQGLHEFINKDDLPNEYGGKLGSFKELHKEMLKNVKGNTDFFAENEKLVADESKRQGKPKNMGDIFGIEGTFKKLDID